jgi:hypothetical protein
MSEIEPPDPDAIFTAIMENESFDTDTTDVQDVTVLDDLALLNQWHTINDQLRDLGEQLQLSTSTDEGRELHSRRAAIRIELAKRNLL